MHWLSKYLKFADMQESDLYSLLKSILYESFNMTFDLNLFSFSFIHMHLFIFNLSRSAS